MGVFSHMYEDNYDDIAGLGLPNLRQFTLTMPYSSGSEFDGSANDCTFLEMIRHKIDDIGHWRLISTPIHGMQLSSMSISFFRRKQVRDWDFATLEELSIHNITVMELEDETTDVERRSGDYNLRPPQVAMPANRSERHVTDEKGGG